MRRRNTTLYLLAVLSLIVASCDHSAAFDQLRSPVLGPATSGPDILLTYNSDQNYWPVLTEDGTGVLYAFVDSSQASSTQYDHRCIGLMSTLGGSRLWQWCDDRAELADSLSSFPAYALGSDGRLLYLESTSVRNLSFALGETRLWLADSTHPFRRRALLTLPAIAGDSVVSWLADLQWTGPATFIGLAQHYLIASQCVAIGRCVGLDSMFLGEMVVRGTIGSSGAALAPIAGTEGATGYAIAENGSSIAFVMRNSLQLFKVPATGGTPLTVSTVSTAATSQLLGLSCQGSVCVVAVAPVMLWAPVVPGPGSDVSIILPGMAELRKVSITTGESTVLRSMATDDSLGHLLKKPAVYSTPIIASANGDVIAVVGRIFGHLQSTDSVPPFPLPTLHLYPGLVQ